MQSEGKIRKAGGLTNLGFRHFRLDSKYKRLKRNIMNIMLREENARGARSNGKFHRNNQLRT